MIPLSLWHRAVSWYRHYLQHPGHSLLKETMRSVMYWKGMCTTIWGYIKSCRSCQVNKRHSQKYGHLPPKLVITTPWKELCVDLIHGGQDDSILSAKLIRIAPENSSFQQQLLWQEFVFFTKLCTIKFFSDYLRLFPTGYPVILRSNPRTFENHADPSSQHCALFCAKLARCQ